MAGDENNAAERGRVVKRLDVYVFTYQPAINTNSTIYVQFFTCILISNRKRLGEKLNH